MGPRRPETVFGRFDLCWDPDGPSKLYEFNADTPTSLIESAVVQWFWLQDTFGHGKYGAGDDGSGGGDTKNVGAGKDQFNALHELLIEQWRYIRTERWKLPEGAPLYVASLHDSGDGELITEDYDNVAYMAETIQAAGFEPRQIFIESIRWDVENKTFMDLEDRPIRHIYKLYPWEWMVHEKFADQLLAAEQRTQWVEPLWKLLLSNKQLLVVLWEMFPGHPNLLPAFNSNVMFKGQKHVRKPKLGREGANVQILDERGGVIERMEGGYGDEGYVWQQYKALPSFDGWNAVVGSWIVGETPAGVDFRETSTKITGDMAFIVPHYIN
ncbi:MAG TPA: glutathionylspermidine synthase family protein [Candidatus Saccharimonadales bacterium]|jgi:glutathionylspermidine synthase